MFELNNFDAIQIGLASPEKILEWSHGEVLKPETINYRTLKPERDGLFCERIFGPTKDWECHCGKYKRIRHKGVICDKCGVEVTRSKVRRERMGHITLAAPVSHIWYFKGIPGRMGTILHLGLKELDSVLYFGKYIVTDPGDTPLLYKQTLTDEEYRNYRQQYGDGFKAGMGAEAVKKLLMDIDLDKEAEKIRAEMEKASSQKKANLIKRLDIVESFRMSGQRPEWMILDVLPVIPPELRPMVQLDGGRFASSDVNDLYRRVINRNNRLKRMLELGAPEVIVRNEKRMLQEAVDALFDNGRRGRAVTGPGNRPLKSLSELLRGKQGRFRQNLLGKRVDYSGRSVIVVGPELKMYQCGLPKEMAIEMFKPFIMKRLVELDKAHNIKSAKRMVERAKPEVWDILEEVIREHPVLLNRAPTLHRLGIQAFEPVLVEGRALKLHPLVCPAFNADFDGDQMAIHLPLTVEAQAEARFLMLATNNILKPADGHPVASPSQDMVMGCYYLSLVDPEALGAGRCFKDEEEAMMAYELGQISLQAPVKVRLFREIRGEMQHRIVETTVGKLIFNSIIPQNLGFVERVTDDDMFKLEIDVPVKRGMLNKIIDHTFRLYGNTKTAEVIDAIKDLGFHYSTKSAVTVSVSDMVIPETKKGRLKSAEKQVGEIIEAYQFGEISEEERYKAVTKIWQDTTDAIQSDVNECMPHDNPIYQMMDSGARGNKTQIRQLGGMLGLIAKPSGQLIEVPIRANYREGLSVLEFFIASHGARKTLSDTALRTADSGYLTRRLVDVSQDMIVREHDCFAARGQRVKGMVVEAIKDGDREVENLASRIWGRTSVKDVIHPETGEVLCRAGELISLDQSEAIMNAGIKSVEIRTVLTCQSDKGVCAKCYGLNLATGRQVHIGETVGVIAAQSIGEPGTQLTMRTFHSGGVATSEDITQGLPRVEEIFEARKPKGMAIISEIGGTVSIVEDARNRKVIVTSEDGESKEYNVPLGYRMKVAEGQVIEAGDGLTEGPLNPHDILKIKGLKGVQSYLLREVLSTYQSQGVNIADKHIEIIIRQMLRKVRVLNSGDTNLLPGDLVDIFDFDKANEEAIEQDREPAEGARVILGITKASLATNSFLSAAAFQETTRVLTEAAIKGKIDYLTGLKENIILGKLIPAGTGMKCYRKLKLNTEEAENAPEAPVFRQEAEAPDSLAEAYAEGVLDVEPAE